MTLLTTLLQQGFVSDATPWIPTRDYVAALLPRRWREVGGTYADGPTDTTAPTADQVDNIIVMQAALVLAQTGDVSALPCATSEDVQAGVATVIAERAAKVVELGFWPEEITDSRDTASEWQAIIDGDQAAVIASVRECLAGEVEPGDEGDAGGGPVVAPAFNFETQSQRLSF
jgi:hypothetical protein